MPPENRNEYRSASFRTKRRRTGCPASLLTSDPPDQRTVELERRNEDLDAFAHTVAHELKALLSLIVGPAETLAEVHTAISDEELLHYLHMMARSGRKMSDVIDALLLLAQIRREEVEATPLHMAGIVAEAMRRVADVAKERRAEIVVPESWPMALGTSACTTGIPRE